MTDSKQIDDGGLAFPGSRNQQVGNVSDYGFGDDDSPTFAEVQHPGMSLRDWFAGQALVGLYACRDLQLSVIHDLGVTVSFEYTMALQAYRQADAMIAARKAGAA